MNNSLSVVHPELIVEWSKKNLPLTPDGITFGSNKVVWWKGNCGHEWQTSVKARSKGEKCPICSGARAVAGINDLSTLKPGLASEWSKKNEIKPTEVTVGSHKKVIWKCRLGHEWTASVKSRSINGSGCPYCSHNKVLVGFNDLATVVPKVADEWSEKNEKKPTEVTAFANRKAWWKCRDCDYEWNTLISTRSGGSKCPCCSGYTFIKGRNDLKTTHPEIAEEWSEKNYPLQPDEVNAKSRKNVWWHCKKCGNEWKSVINARIKGTVCPVCAEREVLAGYNDLATTDNALSTTKTILVQRSRWILAGIAVIISDFIYFWITKRVVSADSEIAILVVAFAGGVGCSLACFINEKLSKDRIYVNVIMSDDLEEMKHFRDFLAKHHITNVAADSYTLDWDAKTISITAYPETKAESRLINDYIAGSSTKFKRVVQPT